MRWKFNDELLTVVWQWRRMRHDGLFDAKTETEINVVTHNKLYFFQKGKHKVFFISKSNFCGDDMFCLLFLNSQKKPEP